MDIRKQFAKIHGSKAYFWISPTKRMHCTRFFTDVIAISKDDYFEYEYVLVKLLHNGSRGQKMV